MINTIEQHEFDKILKIFNYTIKNEENWEPVDTDHNSINEKLKLIDLEETLDSQLNLTSDIEKVYSNEKQSIDKIKNILHKLKVNNKIIDGEIIKDDFYYDLIK